MPLWELTLRTEDVKRVRTGRIVADRPGGQRSSDDAEKRSSGTAEFNQPKFKTWHRAT